MSTSAGNQLSLHADGDEAFQVTCEAIRRARHRVWVETYIMEPDAVGVAIIELLAEAARRGCDVILLVDGYGSRRIRPFHTRAISQAGGRVAIFNPLFSWSALGRRTASVLRRDHRKIIIADDVAFCGGRNFSVEYGGAGPERFYDVTLRLQGPCVRDLASILLDGFRRAWRVPHPPLPPVPPVPATYAGGGAASVLALDARAHRYDLEHALFEALAGARSRFYLTTPYFVPSARLVKELGVAVGRAVDVRVLTAGVSDLPHARIAGRHRYRQLLTSGVRIYEMQHPTLHAKTLTVDGTNGLVASYNFDQWSIWRHLEVGVMARDAILACALEREFVSNLDRASEVTATAWARRPYAPRLLHWLFYQLSRV